MRTHWKSRAALAALLVLVVVAAWFMVRSGMAHERKEFVSAPEPTSGYRYRWTVSSDWKIVPPITGSHLSGSQGFLSFTPPPPIPFRAWVNEHLLHASPLPPSPIYAFTADANALSGSYQIVQGYPEVVSRHVRILAHKHLRMDGYRATLFRLKILSGSQNVASVLVISIPEHSEMYLVYSNWESPNTDQAYRELQQMSASFHIEKPAVSPSGKH